MPKNFTLQNGATLSVADNPLGEGGEGAVYEILSPANFRNSVAKILYPDKRTNERRYKVRYMVDNPPANIQDGNGHNFLIWPQQILLDDNDFVGFIMSKAEGIDLEELCRVKLKPELGSEWQKFYRDNSDSMILRLILCSNIAKAVNALHATGHYVIGDLKPENIRVKSNGLVSILDLDSCQISDGGQIRFQSKMNTPKYNPPETIIEHKELSWDLFIIGIIFYEILCGIHPFIGTTKAPYENLNTPEQKIQAGLFPFGSKSNYFEVIAIPHYNFKNLPDHVQKLFLRCFDQGITNPAVRPNTTDWLNNLTAKPKIIFFKADKETIISGIEINLSWEVEGADKIEINQEIGNVQSKSEITVKPNENPIFKITATNIFGIVESEIKLNIFPTPLIKTLQIPTPILNHQTSISNFKIETPKIDLGVDLNPNIFVQPTMDFKKLNSDSRNFYHSNNLKKNPISEVFELIQNQISIKLKNRFSQND
jgi:serine/threonine protein kinase